MANDILHVGAGMQCTHGGTVSIAPGQTRVQVGGQPVATTTDMLTVAGCPFQVPVGVGTKPQPCVKVQWSLIASRVSVNGLKLLLQAGTGTGVGICQSAEQIPQGPPTVNQVQQRASGV